MLDPKILDDLSKRFAEALPPGFRQLQLDIEKNFHATLQAAFAKMDLVTREEFDVQQELLSRTRARLEHLEAQVTQLEKKLEAMATAKAPVKQPRSTKGAEKAAATNVKAE